MAALGLCCCSRAFSIAVSRGCFLLWCAGFTEIASLVAEHRLYVRGLSSCGHVGLAAPQPVKSAQASKGN